MLAPQDRLEINLSKKLIPGLNGIRAIAALSVVACHWYFSGMPHASIWGRIPGAYGVISFFILSGFLITHLLLKEASAHGEINLGQFWKRRLFRILPAFVAFWILQAVLIRSVPFDFIAAILYFYNYFQAVSGWQTGLMGHTWSLAVEEQFYLLWPIVFISIKNRINLIRWLSFGVLAVQGARFLAHKSIPIYYTFDAFEFRCDALMIGCLMAVVLWMKKRIPGLLFNPILGGASVLLVSLLSFWGEYWTYSVGAYACAIIILQAMTYAPRILENTLLSYLGRISYSIYLYHELFLDIVKHHHTWNIWILALTYVGGTVAAAALSFELIEKPFLRLRRSQEAKRQRQVKAVLAA